MNEPANTPPVSTAEPVEAQIGRMTCRSFERARPPRWRLWPRGPIPRQTSLPSRHRTYEAAGGIFTPSDRVMQVPHDRRTNVNSKCSGAAVVLLGLGFGIWAAACHSSDRESKPGLLAGASRAQLPIRAPEFAAMTSWLNSNPLKLADQNAKVVIVHFWTNGCINCIHNYPHYRAWAEKYKADHDLVIVGIHTAEFDAEKDLDRIKDQAAKNHLTFPIAVDNEGANWKAWDNRYWPCIYLVDKAGNVRYRWEGELGAEGYKKVTGQIDELLAEPSATGK